MSSVTRSECNVIRDTKRATPSGCIHASVEPRRNLSTECTGKMHGNIYGDCVGLACLSATRPAPSNNERVLASEGTMRCSGNRPGRAGTCPAKALNRKNATAGSISIGISFEYARYNHWAPLGRRKRLHLPGPFWKEGKLGGKNVTGFYQRRNSSRNHRDYYEMIKGTRYWDPLWILKKSARV